VRDFPTLFKGREDAHGEYESLEGREPTERGKIVSKARSLHAPVTKELFQKHLTGADRLGIIPVMSDGRCWWSCIDIDFYKLSGGKPMDYVALAKAVRGTNLVITRSKSGGAHLWSFFQEPVDGREAHKFTKALAEKLALWTTLHVTKDEFWKHCDIFPKGYADEKEKIGFWVNLPYFGDTCHCVGDDGDSDLRLADFLAFANNRLSKPTGAKVTKPKKSDAPPCIDFMRENGVEEGHRDMAVTHFGVYAKQAFPDEWKEKVRGFNDEHVNPPMRSDEVNKIISSLDHKDFFYLCNAIKDIYCDVTECKKRTYGVGKIAPVTDIGIEHIEKIDGDDPKYIVTMNGKKFDCDADQLFTYSLLRKRAMARLNRLLPQMKQGEWEDMLSDHLEMMEITEAAADTQMRDRVISAFQNWCGQCCVIDDFKSAMVSRVPFYDGKTIVFEGDALLSQLDRQLRVSRDDAYVYLRAWGTTQIEREGAKLWCWKQNGPLWFDPYRGKQK
jgi:hypothetical protein